MEKVKFGIIGIGNMGSSHVQTVRVLPNTELKAVCDINPKAFDRIPEAIRSEIRCFTDIETFLKEGDIDAVIVAVPHYSHPACAVAAMKAGKHVLVEKPIAVHKQAAEELLAEAAKHPELKKVLMLNQRTGSAHKKIKELIKSGMLGKIQRINWIITNWFRSQHYYDSGDWRASWAGEGGGVLLNQCPHQLDLLQWFFGMPCKIRAAAKLGKYHDIEVEDEVNAYLEYPDGVTGNFIASTGEMPGTNRLEITCDQGRLVYENEKIEFLRNEQKTSEFIRASKNTFGAGPHWTCTIPSGPETGRSGHGNIIYNMAESILHGEALISPLEEGIKGLEIGNAMLYSGLNDCTVELPLDSKKYAGMLQKLVAASRYRKKTVVSEGTPDNFSSSF